MANQIDELEFCVAHLDTLGYFAVKIEKLPVPILTKTKEKGIGMLCKFECVRLEGRGANVKSCGGLSVCHPLDEFDWVYGAKIALERAMEAMNTNRASRTRIWKMFFKMTEDIG